MNRTEFVGVGDKTALICDDGAHLEAIRGTLEELGFKCHTAETSDRAIERMKYTPYDMVVVSEDFSASTRETNPVLRYLAALPMAQRRHTYVVLVGKSFRTLDAMQAYAESVHMVVHPDDLVNLGAILKKGLSDFELLYRMFRSVQAELGAVV